MQLNEGVENDEHRVVTIAFSFSVRRLSEWLVVFNFSQERGDEILMLIVPGEPRAP